MEPGDALGGDAIIIAGRLYRLPDQLREQLGQLQLPFYPDTPGSTYDPLSDPLNDPFPEELR